MKKKDKLEEITELISKTQKDYELNSRWLVEITELISKTQKDYDVKQQRLVDLQHLYEEEYFLKQLSSKNICSIDFGYSFGQRYIIFKDFNDDKYRCPIYSDIKDFFSNLLNKAIETNNERIKELEEEKD